MGCDIHTYIEKKKDGKWIPAQGFMQTGDDDDELPDVPIYDTFFERNYALFGLLAGVRNSNIVWFKPKGFPKDASKEVKAQFDYWGVDAHTPSYLTKEELDRVDWDGMIDYYGEQRKRKDISQEFTSLVFWLNSYDYSCKPDEIRLVFWFDN
jgi:hypothetical protein